MNSTRKTKPGPKPIDYLPEVFRGIEGAEQITTLGQLRRLRQYLGTPAAERAPFARLGASVPQYGVESDRKPSATYAVTVDGEVRVLRRQCDPRAAHRWFSNARREWNIAAAFAVAEVSR